MSPGERLPRQRRLLAIDTFGAALTAAITLGLLASGVVASGVPSVVWWGLGGLAAGIGLQGLVALWRSWPLASELRRLAGANTAYALGALTALGVFRDTVTTVVAAYVIVEALILMALAAIEWQAARVEP